MIWMIDRGLIQGYGNVLNPKIGQYETLLKPNDTLTEAHFLSIFFRYMKPEEFHSTITPSSWIYSVQYTLAEKYQLPVLGGEDSSSKQAIATQGIRRGTLAHILVSMDKGYTVSEDEAIHFFIQNGLTTAQNQSEFRPDSILTRAQVSAFLQRYNNYKHIMD